MERRELLLAAGGIALATIAAQASAEGPDDHAMAHHHHAGGSVLLDSAIHCVRAAEICHAHCLDLLAEGDKAMAACARSVTGLQAVCSALAVLAAQNSPLLPRYASVARDVCKACEDECRKHVDHAPCKACAEACAACAQECGKIAI
ncbi:MAG: Csp1 family four helix bundle copper storage protein [Proteobacteria bacterium]|nr:Csp1 family four helix bundle copper storage protein [Pseudomonadota bacterium]